MITIITKNSVYVKNRKKLCNFFKVSMDSMAYDELDIQPYDPDNNLVSAQ